MDRRGFFSRVGQGLGLAAIASMYADAQEVPPPTNLRIFSGSQITKPVLTKDDFSYLGCMRMPPETFNTVGDLSSSYSALAARKVNGTLQFFMTGANTPKTGGSQNGQDDVFEFADPGSYSQTYASAPRAPFVRSWGSIYQGKRTSWDTSGNQLTLQYMLTPWLLWNNNRLYWMYFDSYNVSSRDDWSFGMTDLKDGPGNMVSYGPWRATTPGGGPGVKHASGWMVVMPDGTLGVGSPRESGPWSSWGPELIGGLPFPTDATPGGFGKPNLAFPRTYVQYQQMYQNLNMDGSLQSGKPIVALRRTGDYVFHNVNPSVGYAQPPSEMNPALSNGQGSFTQADGVSGCVYIESATKQGYLFAGMMATGHVWYGPAENCGHGLGNPCGGGQGQNSTGSRSQWWIYDGAVLQQVANGKLTPNQVQPSSAFDPQAQISNNIKLGCNHPQTGMYYDKDTSRLFIASPFADDSVAGVNWPLVHVYHVN